ncbi:Unknown protein sequence [Pseudomonas syringae pv. maculicola]|nr:Unknown protein sequence [Pseudomonas syringae pv. maculicola]
MCLCASKQLIEGEQHVEKLALSRPPFHSGKRSVLQISVS